jgi:hypothetical protein
MNKFTYIVCLVSTLGISSLQATSTITFVNQASQPVSVDVYWMDDKGKDAVDIPANGNASITTDNCVGKALFWKSFPKTTFKTTEVPTANGKTATIKTPLIEYYTRVQPKVGPSYSVVNRASQPYTGIQFVKVPMTGVFKNPCAIGFVVKSDYSVESSGGAGKKFSTEPLKRAPSRNEGQDMTQKITEETEDIFKI